MSEDSCKLVVEASLMEQVWYQIDRYLQKKWPDIFIHDELKVLKAKIESGIAHLEDDKNRLKLYRERELRIDALINDITTENRSIKNRISKLETTLKELEPCKWWKFWKPRIVIMKYKEKEEDEIE